MEFLFGVAEYSREFDRGRHPLNEATEMKVNSKSKARESELQDVSKDE
jgi:hypothetical protein